MIRSTTLLGCGLALAACGVAPPPQPAAGTQFDGTYAGQDVLLSGAAFQCGQPSLAERIEVREGRFAYPFQVSPPRVAPLPVQLAVDGAAAGQMQYGTGEEIPAFSRDRVDWVYFQGRISGDALDATITNTRCVRRLRARRG